MNKAWQYITRSWDDELKRNPEQRIHPRMRLLPPICIDVLGFGFVLSIIYHVGAWIITLFNKS